MSTVIYFPADEFTKGPSRDIDLAADFLELNAVFSKECQSLSQDIVDALESAAEAEYESVEAEIEVREDIAAQAVACMSFRNRVLSTSYPFEVDDNGEVIYFSGDLMDLGQTAYLVSLILSNLESVSPLLVNSQIHPTDEEIRHLRQYFQYFATAAIAGEVGGPAWSFGFPRPDGSGFIKKLSEIWECLQDGEVYADPSAPERPKDDQVDIFAWRKQLDGLPGFLLIAAQVASGKDWRSKSIKSHVRDVFPNRWFSPSPASVMVAYQVIPFTQTEDKFRADVMVLGNVLHRLRVPTRVSEAAGLVRRGVKVETFELLGSATEWVQSYLKRKRAL